MNKTFRIANHPYFLHLWNEVEVGDRVKHFSYASDGCYLLETFTGTVKTITEKGIIIVQCGDGTGYVTGRYRPRTRKEKSTVCSKCGQTIGKEKS